MRLNQPNMGVVIEPAEGTTFLNASPDPEIYGERELDTGEPKDAKDDEMFMYFVMPMRLNG